MALRVHRTLRRSDAELGEPGSRLGAFGAFVFVWVALLGFRLFDLQVQQHEEFAELARSQQQTVVELDAPRGTIVDRRGRELAISVQVKTIYANPLEVQAEDAVARVAGELSKALGWRGSAVRDLEKRLGQSSTFTFVARKLDPEIAEGVLARDLPGVYSLEESRREYPMGELAAHILGYVGTDNVGLAGLEHEYDGEVRGRSARRPLLRDASGTRFVAPWSLEETPQAGADLVLTLDATLQQAAENALTRAVERHRAKAGIMVILDAADSAVLALANVPTFDPNRFQVYSEDARHNRAVVDAYEPGSTFKMITAAAVLESLAVRPDDRFDCENGAIVVSGQRIGDHKPFGVLTFREVLANSSNVGTIKAALKMGGAPLQQAVRDFGFGTDTGIDLGYENSGLVPSKEWTSLDAAYASFGHGISVSPIQLANAYAALAAGRLNRPYVVGALRRGDELIDARPEAGRPLNLSAATRKDLIRLLEGVVEQGTGEPAAVAGFRVAGKTGTAQKSDRRGYSATGRLASFVGLAPAGAPRLVGLVMIDEPRDVTGGGVVAGPIFAEVMETALLYLGIAPDRDVWERRTDFLALRRPSPARTEPVEGAEAPTSGLLALATLRGQR